MANVAVEAGFAGHVPVEAPDALASGTRLIVAARVPANVADLLAAADPSAVALDRAIEESLAVWGAATGAGHLGVDYRVRSVHGRKVIEVEGPVANGDYPRADGGDVVEAAQAFLALLWSDIAAIADEAPATARAGS